MHPNNTDPVEPEPPPLKYVRESYDPSALKSSTHMKHLIAILISPVLYFFGHCISIPMHWPYLGFLYYPYNKLMCWSGDLEDWAGKEVMWRSEDETDLAGDGS